MEVFTKADHRLAAVRDNDVHEHARFSGVVLENVFYFCYFIQGQLVYIAFDVDVRMQPFAGLLQRDNFIHHNIAFCFIFYGQTALDQERLVAFQKGVTLFIDVGKDRQLN